MDSATWSKLVTAISDGDNAIPLQAEVGCKFHPDSYAYEEPQSVGNNSVHFAPKTDYNSKSKALLTGGRSVNSISLIQRLPPIQLRVSTVLYVQSLIITISARNAIMEGLFNSKI
jgi:hypothetical protein